MALYATPRLTKKLRTKLDELDQLRTEIGRGTASPAHWVTRLRRQVQATAYSSSTKIEGFQISDDEATAVIAGNVSSAGRTEGQIALACYLHAMKHVAVLATDPTFEWNTRVILDLHFDACSFQEDKRPGTYRTGWIGVRDPHGGLVYEGPSETEVPSLMTELGEWLAHDDDSSHFVVKAAMTHLHVASIHPFADGNGRVARILQSLVLARHGDVTPEFGSIEEFIALHATDYYAALGAVQGGSYSPGRNVSAWLEFCISAHIDQANRRLAQLEAAALRWESIEKIISDRNWPERLAIALEQALMGGTDRAKYLREADIATPTASGDFRRLLDSGLVEQQGRGPITRYVATEDLRAELERTAGRTDRQPRRSRASDL